MDWAGFRPMYDAWGNEIQRFFQLETLARATEALIERGDRFIVPSVQEVLGPSPVRALRFTLFQEGRFQHIFRLDATNLQKRKASFAFVVAKEPDDATTVAKEEHGLLRRLHEAMPRYVVQPYLGGTLFLPDRHGRREKARIIYAYLTRWMPNFHELGLDRHGRYILNIDPPHTLSAAQTETIKRHAVATVAGSHDAKAHTCMMLPELASGDFVVTHPAQEKLKVKLIACRGLLSRMDPPRIIDKLRATSWRWGDTRVDMLPAAPGDLFTGLEMAWGTDRARAELTGYVAGVRRRRFRKLDPVYLDALAALAER